jgi:hypothetical protein
MVGDRDLVDALVDVAVKLRHFHRELRFNPESIRPEGQTLENLSLEYLILDLRIAQMRMCSRLVQTPLGFAVRLTFVETLLGPAVVRKGR